MKGIQRVTEGDKIIAVEPGTVLPFRQRRKTFERCGREAGDHARGQALGQTVDRLDGRQPGHAPLVENPVRVDHLPPAVPELDLSGNEASLADGKELFEPQPLRVEEDEGHVAGLVFHEHPVGRAAAARRGGPVRDDGHGKRHRLADRRVGDRTLELARNSAARQVQEEVEHPRRLPLVAEETVEKRRNFGADAGQGCRRSKQRVEN